MSTPADPLPVPAPAGSASVTSVAQGGDPSPEELAAIMAAVEVAWPRVVATAPTQPELSRWRFSGRWWTKPVPVRRDRPL